MTRTELIALGKLLESSGYDPSEHECKKLARSSYHSRLYMKFEIHENACPSGSCQGDYISRHGYSFETDAYWFFVAAAVSGL